MSDVSADDPLGLLLAAPAAGPVHTVSVAPDGVMAADAPPPRALLPGSFDPLHEGHERLLEVASRMLGDGVAFELSVANVDKPPLDEAEVRRRLRQFEGRWPVLLTRAPRFIDKARLVPGATFVIGWDTAVRLVEPAYYGGTREMHEALEEMRASACRFLVAGREHEHGFRSLRDAPIPARFAPMFEAIPEARFRVDVSSTQLRGE